MLKKLVSILAALLVLIGLPAAVFAEEHGEPPIEELEQEYYDLVHPLAENDFQVPEGESVADLEEELEQLMSDVLVDYYVALLEYEEGAGTGDIIPEHPPLWVHFDENYTVEQISDTEYQLAQSSANEAGAETDLTVTYLYDGDKWIIDERTEIIIEEGGGLLADTATTAPGYVLFGSVLIGLGTLMIIRKRVN